MGLGNTIRSKFFLSRMTTLFVICFVAALFANSAAALEPTDKWEGSIEYAATGGSFLLDTGEARTYGDPITGEITDYEFIPGIFDGEGDTVLNNSTATMYGIPDNVNVVKATLVWMGSIDHGTMDPDAVVSLRPPNGFITPIFAEDAQLSEIYSNNPEAPYHYFTYRVDITEILRRHVTTDGLPLNGDYVISGFEASASDLYLYGRVVLGGWSLFIVYSKADLEPKKIYYYTTFQQIQANSITLRPSGFVVPEDAEAKATFFMGEGDQHFYGPHPQDPAQHEEALKFNGTALTDECNTADNAYNGTVNTNIMPSEYPCRRYVHSIDLDTFDVGDLLDKGDERATVLVSLGADAVFTNYFLLSIDTKLPDFDIPNEPEKTASVQSGSALYPGQKFTYFIHVQNNGKDDAQDVRVRDQLPSDVTYVPNSTVVVEPDGTRRSVDDLSGGQPPCLTGIDIADVIPPGEEYRRTVEIGVQLNSLEQGVTKETIIQNTAEIISNNGDVYFTNGGVPVQHTVQLESFEGTLHFRKGAHNPGDRFVQPGAKNVKIAHINLLATNGNVQLASFKFTAVDDPDNIAGIIRNASLYIDENSNGQLDNNDTLLDVAEQWSGGGLVFTDFEELPEIAANEEVDLLVVADVASDAEPGMWGQVELTENGVSVRGFTEGLPFTAAKLTVPSADTHVTVELGDNNPPDKFLEAGAAVPVMQLKFRAYAVGAKIFGVNLNSEGTVHDPTEVIEVKLHRDMNGNGQVDPGDLQLGESQVFSSDNGLLSFDNFNLPLSEDEDVFVVVFAAFKENIGTDKRFRLSLMSNGDINAGIQNVAGAPITGSLFTFSSGEVVECNNDLECRGMLGVEWTCDQVQGLCVKSGSTGDGDVADGDIIDGDTTDGDFVDGDFADGDTDEEDGGGGCNQTSQPAWMLLFAFSFILLRRKLTA